MTLIVGFNFSHKLYLAGDTRVTRIVNGANERLYIDNILKVVPLWGREIREQSFVNDDTITLAVAGDVHFAAFLYRRIQQSLNRRELSSDIRELSEEVSPLLQKHTDEWLKCNNYANCVLLFGGMTKKRRKRISNDKLNELVSLFEKRKKEDAISRRKFETNDLHSDPIWQLLNKKMLKEAGESVSELLAEGDKPVISNWIQQALDVGEDEVDMPDSLLLGIEIKPKQGVFRKDVAEWGEFLAYGAGLTKNDMPQDLLSMLELSHVKDVDKGPHLIEGALITQTILDIAREGGINSIGGTVVLLPTSPEGQIMIQGKDVRMQSDGRFCLEFFGKKIPLVPFHQFPTDLAMDSVLEM